MPQALDSWDTSSQLSVATAESVNARFFVMAKCNFSSIIPTTPETFEFMKITITTLASVAALALSSLSLSNCANGVVAQVNAAGVDPEALAQSSRSALNSLCSNNRTARTLRNNAKAILVFPEITKGGFIVGGMGGNGALVQPGGGVRDFYQTGGLSYGFQAGVQEYGYALFLMDDSAINALNNSEGWAVGSSPNLVVMDSSVSISGLSSSTMNKGTYAFFFNRKGLMGGAGLEGTKITRIHPGR